MNYTKLMFTLLVVLLAVFRCSAVQDEITAGKATAQIQQIEIKPETAFFLLPILAPAIVQTLSG